jgi:hypothetical protein
MGPHVYDSKKSAILPQKAKNSFFSIHKPPALIRFATIMHALAVTVEPFEFSSRQVGVAYELSRLKKSTLKTFIRQFLFGHMAVCQLVSSNITCGKKANDHGKDQTY